MIFARPEEGPRAPLFYGALAVACSGLANAQAVDIEELENCAGLATEALKLACFEAVIASGRQDQDPEPAVEPSSGNEPEVAAAAPVIAVEPEPVPAAAAEPDPAPQPERMPVPDPESLPAVAGEPEQQPDGAKATASDDFGSEQLRKSTDTDPGEYHARVVEVSKGYRDALSFHLENGQVWRQIEPRHFSYPRNTAFDVVISQGMMGEYRLRVEQSDGEGRMVRIRRVK